MNSHFCAVTHGRVNNGVPELLYVAYKERDYSKGRHKATKRKFPGGMGEGSESVLDTVRFEAGEELAGSGFELLSVDEVWRTTTRSHTKVFFVMEYAGELRKNLMTEGDGTVLFEPKYEDVRVLLGSLTLSHIPALLKIITHYAKIYPEFAYVAWDFV